MHVFYLERCSEKDRAPRALVGVLPVLAAKGEHLVVPLFDWTHRVSHVCLFPDLCTNEPQYVNERKLF